MATAENDLLPTASQCLLKSAKMEAEKIAGENRKQKVADAEKKALLDRLTKPSGVSEEDRMKRAAAIIKRAVSNGLVEVEVARFPNELFTDRGRAINQQEPGWEATLTGLPKELFQFWQVHLKPRGYRLRCEIAEWPDGRPGDIAMTLMWNK